MQILGVDTGGTFTDFVHYDGERFRVHKVLSTPQAPEQAVLQGVEEMGLALEDLLVVHGSTVATNAVLEGKGVRTAYITNRGLGDVLAIGRQARGELYALQPAPMDPPVPASLCLETGGRLAADGAVVEPLTETDLAGLKAELARLAPQAVAVNLLFSFLDDRFERAVEAAVPPGVFVSRASEVLPEVGEYERGVATWLNAYVGPLMQGYLQRLSGRLRPARLVVMQSHGGTVAAEQAGRHAVRLLLSGPAGGLMGARYLGEAAGRRRLLTFDMGGTSTDVALIDGELRLTSEGRIGPYPVAVPMVDMHTIGAGGGSIARVDAGGLLQVGPQSAGADPGPACYGRGGESPTVTDANLVLGRLPAGAALGGRMRLDLAAARRAVARVAGALGIGLEEAALGIVKVANEHMAQALRVISVQRGLDPADYTLMPFGGAGGLHVCALADLLGVREVLVPAHGGVLSALGMLVAPPARRLSQALPGLLAERPVKEIEARLQALAERGRAELAQEGVVEAEAQFSVDLRYLGQSATLNLPWGEPGRVAEAFHRAHEQAYGHRLDGPVELVNLRAAVAAPPRPLALTGAREGPPAAPVEHLPVWGVDAPVPVYVREDLAVDQSLTGPALVSEAVATTYIEPGWRGEVHPSGALLLRRAGAA